MNIIKITFFIALMSMLLFAAEKNKDGKLQREAKGVFEANC